MFDIAMAGIFALSVALVGLLLHWCRTQVEAEE